MASLIRRFRVLPLYFGWAKLPRSAPRNSKKLTIFLHSYEPRGKSFRDTAACGAGGLFGAFRRRAPNPAALHVDSSTFRAQGGIRQFGAGSVYIVHSFLNEPVFSTRGKVPDPYGLDDRKGGTGGFYQHELEVRGLLAPAKRVVEHVATCCWMLRNSWNGSHMPSSEPKLPNGTCRLRSAGLAPLWGA